MADAMPVSLESGEVKLPPEGKAFVYRAYADDGCLLYIGSTISLLGRIGEHYRRRAEWMRLTARIAWDRYVNLAEAQEAEMRLIGQLAPQYNFTHNTHAPPAACPHPSEAEHRAYIDQEIRGFPA